MPKPSRSQVPPDLAKRIAGLPPRPDTSPRMVEASELIARQAANAAVCSKLFVGKRKAR